MDFSTNSDTERAIIECFGGGCYFSRPIQAGKDILQLFWLTSLVSFCSWRISQSQIS